MALPLLGLALIFSGGGPLSSVSERPQISVSGKMPELPPSHLKDPNELARRAAEWLMRAQAGAWPD